MKKIILVFCSFLFIFFSCTTPKKKSIKEDNPTVINKFVLNGTLHTNISDKVYLNKILENTLYPVDSSTIINNQFIFEGVVEYPERFALTFNNYATPVIFILENTNFQIELKPTQLQEPTLINSPLNYKLNAYKTHSKNIFKKIDYLFPQFQKARLENDADELAEIGKKMQLIEKEFSDFSFQFIQNNQSSYVSGMILRDQLKASTVDTLKIINAYHTLSLKVKNAPDATIVAESLKLH
ncbi:protein of unknown function [Lutibacter agarilyticus]|uniref:DUF4369 domain-containing protein n=1 Tax=Lutibacter agarilyticus TaxID=1109740 RepID=A0A238WV91_9FLAO|nr:DUF4369 domain-containing protein [Lutibacter agarilyticus]SNR50467.1 protein of unknown function [Lutibacter agarilyticus]